MYLTLEQPRRVGRLTEERCGDPGVEVVMIELRQPLQRGDTLTVQFTSQFHSFGRCTTEVYEISSGGTWLDAEETRPAERALHLLEHQVVTFDPEMLLTDVQVAAQPI